MLQTAQARAPVCERCELLAEEATAPRPRSFPTKLEQLCGQLGPFAVRVSQPIDLKGHSTTCLSFEQGACSSFSPHSQKSVKASKDKSGDIFAQRSKLSTARARASILFMSALRVAQALCTCLWLAQLTVSARKTGVIHKSARLYLLLLIRNRRNKREESKKSLSEKIAEARTSVPPCSAKTAQAGHEVRCLRVVGHRGPSESAPGPKAPMRDASHRSWKRRAPGAAARLPCF